MLKIWGRINSINVQKVMWAVAELDLQYEHVNAGLHFGGVNEPWYRAMNPNGRVPVINDDGFVLWESNSIVRYLASRYGAGTLEPLDLRTRADAGRWMDWASSTMNPLMTPLFWGLIRTAPDKRNAEALDESRSKMEEVMAILDAQLAQRAFVAGDDFTMGDIPVACFTQRWLALPMAHGVHPHVARWVAQLEARPGFVAHVKMPLS